MYLIKNAGGWYERYNGIIGSLEYTKDIGYRLGLPKRSRVYYDDSVFFYKSEVEKLIEKECT